MRKTNPNDKYIQTSYF